jgi:BioD-like phosphotransacetylase family protein
MAALYVTSTGEDAGRTVICMGLGKVFQLSGRKVGYLKPVTFDSKDKDAQVMKEALNLDEADSVRPISPGAKGVDAVDEAAVGKAKEALDSVSKGKDVVLVEGTGNPAADKKLAVGLGARAILVVRYEDSFGPDRVLEAARALGDRLAGVVVNAVPELKRERVRILVAKPLEESGIEVLGILPEIRALFAVTVGELAEHVGGSILNAQDRTGEIVESVMVGALSADSALSYLKLKDNKAVVTRGDHADIQLAALNTSTACLILTENIDPLPVVLSRAQEVDVPIVKVEKDTASTMEAVESVLEKAGTHYYKRAELLVPILRQYLDTGNL